MPQDSPLRGTECSSSGAHFRPIYLRIEDELGDRERLADVGTTAVDRPGWHTWFLTDRLRFVQQPAAGAIRPAGNVRATQLASAVSICVPVLNVPSEGRASMLNT
jgi:hypothetical protein